MRSVRVGGDQIITVGAPDNQRPYRDEDGRKHHRSRAPRTWPAAGRGERVTSRRATWWTAWPRRSSCLSGRYPRRATSAPLATLCCMTARTSCHSETTGGSAGIIALGVR